MTKRLALLAVGVAAAGSFVLPTAASAEPPCFSQDVRDCLRPVRQVCLLLLDNCDIAS